MSRFSIKGLILKVFSLFCSRSSGAIKITKRLIWSGARFKNEIENNSTWEGTFYQSERVKIYSRWVILVLNFMCVAANASKLFCLAYLENIEHFLYNSNLSF